MRKLNCLNANSSLTHGAICCKYSFIQNAIEYYESMGCEKYQYFKRRIQKLQVKPLVQSILQGKSSALSFKKEEIERRQR